METQTTGQIRKWNNRKTEKHKIEKYNNGKIEKYNNRNIESRNIEKSKQHGNQ